MTTHYVLKCSTCDKVISQCRCMVGNKEVKYKVCDECREKDRTNIIEVCRICGGEVDSNHGSVCSDCDQDHYED